MLKDDAMLRGTLHVFVAFDWGDELDLDKARQLYPAQSQDLARRRRTPSSIAYRPAPLLSAGGAADRVARIRCGEPAGRGDCVRFRRDQRFAANSI